eukprot:scaffold48_cov395-Prasinococcus_capsulatus_cf.AAC.34
MLATEPFTRMLEVALHTSIVTPGALCGYVGVSDDTNSSSKLFTAQSSGAAVVGYCNPVGPAPICRSSVPRPCRRRFPPDRHGRARARPARWCAPLDALGATRTS